jgi:ParB-like chromosome segregation protein Spo0J
VRTLVDVDEVDPVVVSKGEHQLIDGRHRLAAAVARGDQHIECVEVDVCDELEALEHSALANAHRGLPLTTGERRALVGEILRRAPEWADRRIAGVAGVSPTTVGTLRRRLVADATVQSGHHRVGRDGRTRAYAPKPPSPDGPATDGGPPAAPPAARRGRWLGLLRRLVGSILAILRWRT